ncbi:translation initiation factor IF-1 [uncultured Azohydromonas sp.]|uniref:translation initiation factor IF-1 n=1 Tax=uncultured Azohydromonas sp. TaxID=487342 RepID=UPI0026351A04|nr:translation initiation factor IF-1 [uncultured Azohydromonas sp.]
MLPAPGRVLFNGRELVASLTAGRMRKHRSRTLAGDSVSLELSPCGLGKAPITFHHLEHRTPGATTPGAHAR